MESEKNVLQVLSEIEKELVQLTDADIKFAMQYLIMKFGKKK